MNKHQTQKLSLQNLKSARLTLEDTDFSVRQKPGSHTHQVDKYDSFDDEKDCNYLILEPEKENFAGFANPERFTSFADNQPWDPNLEKNLARLRASAPLLPSGITNNKTAPKSSQVQAIKFSLDDSDIISDQTTKQDSQNTQSSSSNSQKQFRMKPTPELMTSQPRYKETNVPKSKPKNDLFSDLINMIDGKDMRSSLNLKSATLSNKHAFNSQKSNSNQEVECNPPEINQYDYDFAPCLEIPRIKQKSLHFRSRSNSRRLLNEFSPDRLNEELRIKTEGSESHNIKAISGKSNYHRSPQTQDREITKTKRVAKKHSNDEKFSHRITNFLHKQKFDQPDSIAVSPIKVVQEQPSNIIGFDQQAGEMINQEGFEFTDEGQQGIGNLGDFRSKDKESEFNTESFQELSLLLEQNQSRKNERKFCGYKQNLENYKGKASNSNDSKPNMRHSQQMLYANESQDHLVSELNYKIAELTEMNSSLAKQNYHLQQENQRLRSGFEEKGLLVVSLKNQMDHLLPKLERLKHLENSAAKNKEKVQKLESENNDLRRSHSRLEKELASIENSYRTQLETLRREMEVLPEEFQYIDSHRALKPKQEDLKQSKNLAPSLGARKSQDNFKLLDGSPIQLREKLEDGDTEARKMLKELLHYKKNTERFIKCIIKMVVDCAPPNYVDGQMPDLKLAWKFIKKMMTEFAAMKKEIDYLKKDEEFLQKCTDLLFLEEKSELLSKLNEILTKKNRLSKIVSKVKLHLNLSSLEEIENYFGQIMSPVS